MVRAEVTWRQTLKLGQEVSQTFERNLWSLEMFPRGAMRQSRCVWTWNLQMTHTSVLILFIQPVNKVKTSLGSSFPAHWHRFTAVLPAQCRRGLSAVITAAGKQRPAVLKDPWQDGRCGPLHGQTPCRPRRRLPRPAAPRQAAADWSAAACWPLTAGREEGRGAFWIIIMLPRCHLQHKTGPLDIPPTRERDFFFFSFSLFLWLKWNFLTAMVLFSHFSQSTKRRGAEGDIWTASTGWAAETIKLFESYYQTVTLCHPARFKLIYEPFSGATWLKRFGVFFVWLSVVFSPADNI